MSPRIVTVAVAVVVSAWTLPAVTQAANLYVGSAANCDFHDIRNAIAAAAAGDVLFVAPRDTAYVGHLMISKSLTLAGTDACGNGTPPNQSTPFATIGGAGGSDAPVITITGTSDVTIKGLEITGGHASSSNGYGGGIAFRGSGGSLHLANVVIHHNTAWRGGGLAVSPVGTTLPNIYLDENVQIFFNTTTDAGAGIYIDGRTELFVMGVGDFIAFNTAAASGGGLFVRGPAHAALGSPGLNGALIAFNQAQYGGGIAAYGEDGSGSSSDAQLVSLFATDAHSPINVSDNTATIAGGGLYVKPDSYAQICAQDFVIDGNVSPEAAAVYVDFSEGGLGYTGPGSEVYLNTQACRSAAAFSAVHCARGVRCNEISDNATFDAAGHTTDNGAVVNVGNRSTFQGSGLRMQGNTAAHLFHTTDHELSDMPTITLKRLLTGGNSLTHELIRMEGEGGRLTLQQSTLAPDIIGAPQVINFDNALPDGPDGDGHTSSFILFDTIIDEPGTLAVHHPGGIDSDDPKFNINHVLSNDITTLPGAPTIVLGTPLFVDAVAADVHARDYHLRAYMQDGQVTASPGIDFAPVGEGPANDLDGAPFDRDVPLVHDFSIGWFRDVGAYEAQPIADRIFADAFGDAVSLVY